MLAFSRFGTPQLPFLGSYKALMPMAACMLWICSGAVALSMPTTNLLAKVVMNRVKGSQLPGS